MNNPSALITTRGDLVRDLNDLLQLSNVLMKSGLLPAGIKTPEAAAVIILKGRELGIGAMEAFAGINVISGKPTISPQLMLALINRSGLMEDLAINDDGKTCVVGMTRKGRKPHSERFSMDDAARMTTQEKGETISLANKYNWRSMPAVMRKWRAISACARVVFPDVIEGLYLPEEMGADVDEEGEIVDAVAVTTAEPPSPIQQSTNVTNPVKIIATVTATDGNGHESAPAQTLGLPSAPNIPTASGKVIIPEALATLVKQYAKKTYAADKREGARGLAVGTLDEYAGDTQRRRTFLMAVFGVDSSKKLTDGAIYAINAWSGHPQAKSEVNRVIADYLRINGQTELPLA